MLQRSPISLNESAPLKRFILNKQKALQTIAHETNTELGFSARHTMVDSMDMSPLNISQIKRDLRHRKNRLSKQGYLDQIQQMILD
jgi:hypothetical protein